MCIRVQVIFGNLHLPRDNGALYPGVLLCSILGDREHNSEIGPSLFPWLLTDWKEGFEVKGKGVWGNWLSLSKERGLVEKFFSGLDYNLN